MKYAPNLYVFMDLLDREYPAVDGNLMLPFPDDYEAPKIEETIPALSGAFSSALS